MSVAERRQREREQRRDRILDAAARVFYAKGPEQATMDDVAREGQLGKGTLYLYFETKEELLLGLALRKQLAMLERFEHEALEARDGRDLVRRLLATFANEISTPREHLRMVMTRWASGVSLGESCASATQARDNVQRIFGALCAAIERGQSDGTIRRDHEPRRLAMQLHCAVNGALLMQLQVAGLHGDLLAHAPSVAEEIDLVLDAIRPRADDEPALLIREGARSPSRVVARRRS